MSETKTSDDFQKMYPGAMPQASFGTDPAGQPDESSDLEETAGQDKYSAAPTANK